MEAGDCDVAIVGGGPAGASLAYFLASRGTNVHLFEEHASIGSPSHCAGLVGPDMAKLPDIGDLVTASTINKVRGAVFVSPGGRRFTVQGEAGSALVLDRKLFDHTLGERAADEGAKLHLKARVEDLHGRTLRVRRDSTHISFSSRIIVGATGPRFFVASHLGERGGNTIPGIQQEMTKLHLDEELVHVYFGSEISDGLFGWVIPIDSGTARIGLCSRTNTKRRFERFLRTRIWPEFGKGKTLEVNAGSIAYGIRENTVFDNTLLLGDEALQTKPATGGGIHYSLICSKIASNSILSYLLEGTPITSYERAWRRRLQREIRFGLAARRVYEGLRDSEIDRLFSALSGSMADRLSKADFDTHSTVSDAFIGFLPRMVKELGLARSLGLGRRLLGGPRPDGPPGP